MVYALWDGSALIEPPHLMAALAVQTYCEASSRYVFGEKLGNPIADTILASLRNAFPDGLTRTEIRDLFDRNAPPGAITTALQDIQSLGRATMTRRQPNGRGVLSKSGATANDLRRSNPLFCRKRKMKQYQRFNYFKSYMSFLSMLLLMRSTTCWPGYGCYMDGRQRGRPRLAARLKQKSTIDKNDIYDLIPN